MGAHLKAAITAVRRAGSFLKANLGRIKEISFKGEINLVTDIDRKSETLIIKYLRSKYPDYAIVSEETAPTAEEAPYKWIIDPLDGTTNYAHAFPFFCVSVALERKGEIVVGAICDPMRNELFFAEKGKGAYLNNRRIRVSDIDKLNRALLATGFTYKIRQDRTNVVHFERFLMRAQAIRRAGSAALDLCYVACGRFDGFWEMDLNPWDTAAGKLIVEEARGKVTDFSGKKYSIYSNQILASNGKIHKAMIAVLGGKR